jgi:hypothetical protein
MANAAEYRQADDRFGVRLATPHRAAYRILTLILSTCVLGTLLFLVLVVAPSAGAAGGCGGG